MCLYSIKQAFVECYYSFTVPGSVKSLSEEVTCPRHTATFCDPSEIKDCEDLMRYHVVRCYCIKS